MNSSNDPAADFFCRMRPALAGLFCAVLTLLFGFGLGVVFGANEDAIKSRLKASATEVRTSVYRDDDATIKAALDKSWTYVQRAHLHAGGLGATAVALILVTVLLGSRAGWTRAISLGLGIGGLGYSVYWLWAAFRLPPLGNSSLAKESLEWLAMPSSGAFVLSTVAVAGLLIAAMRRKTDVKPAGVAIKTDEPTVVLKDT